jgi:hypothetical protein
VVEQLIQGHINAIPVELDETGRNVYAPLEPYEDFFKMLRDLGAIAELGFKLNKEWDLVVDDEEEPYIRGFIDIIVPPKDGVIHIYELKSGKEWPDHVDQRNFYGSVSLALPWTEEPEQVRVIGTYMDLGKNVENSYEARMFNTYKYFWDQRLAQMDNEQAQVPNPGPYCRWCPFSRDKGGPCKFSGD